MARDRSSRVVEKWKPVAMPLACRGPAATIVPGLAIAAPSLNLTSTPRDWACRSRALSRVSGAGPRRTR